MQTSWNEVGYNRCIVKFQNLLQIISLFLHTITKQKENEYSHEKIYMRSEQKTESGTSNFNPNRIGADSACIFSGVYYL